MKWHSIKSAPKDGRQILVSDADDNYIAYYDTAFGFVTIIDEQEIAIEPTHWLDFGKPSDTPSEIPRLREGKTRSGGVLQIPTTPKPRIMVVGQRP